MSHGKELILTCWFFYIFVSLRNIYYFQCWKPRFIKKKKKRFLWWIKKMEIFCNFIKVFILNQINVWCWKLLILILKKKICLTLYSWTTVCVWNEGSLITELQFLAELSLLWINYVILIGCLLCCILFGIWIHIQKLQFITILEEIKAVTSAFIPSV